MLAIVGGKGGCGKTTTALGVARALADRGERPLVVDADCEMPNLHRLAETDRCPGLAAVAAGADLPRSIHRSSAFPGVDVLPAGDASVSVEEAALERLARTSHTVILDCPAGASRAVATPLRAADAALVVSTDGAESLTDAVKTARMADALGTRVLGGVVTRVDDAGPGVGGLLCERCTILGTVPEVQGRVLHSPAARAAYEGLARDVRRNI